MTETEKTIASLTERQEPLTISVKDFMAGVGSVFYGVTQILQSITPAVALAIAKDAVGKEGDESNGGQNQTAGPTDHDDAAVTAGDGGAGGEQPAVEDDEAEAASEAPDAEQDAVLETEPEPPVEPPVESPIESPVESPAESPKKRKAAKRAEKPAETTTVTVDDITKIIVSKIKQSPSNNAKIGALLKSYGVEKISSLPASKYEAFLTDISQI